MHSDCPKWPQATSFVTQIKFRQVKRQKTATNLVMMLTTKQAVELSAYFVMVYFPIHSVTLVWQMLLELRNSLNCYPLNLFKLQ